VTPLRALLWMPRASEIPGGHRVQFDQTAKALAARGVEIATSFDSAPSPEGFDLVHGFGLTAREVHACRSRRIPVAISTIYWNRRGRTSAGSREPTARDRVAKVVRAARMTRAALRERPDFVAACVKEAQAEVAFVAAFSAADVLLPNARGEAQAIVDDLDVQTPAFVVPNAVDPSEFKHSDGGRTERTQVLCVGRIEPHKNQLGLIEALRGSGYDLVIAGPAHPHHLDYEKQCRQAGAGWVTFLGPVPHEQLARHFVRARVHVLPTWFETTGLASLEAALCGCAIVSTSNGHAGEYFADFAHYCDPADPATIRDAVDGAWRAGPRPELEERILANYTWEHTADATLEAYRFIVAR